MVKSTKREINDKTYSVYMHIFPDGKKYIGMTSDIEQRWTGNGSGYTKERSRIRKAVNKYNWKTEVEHIVMAENLTKEEAEQMEISLIEKYHTTNERYGYNTHGGGSGKKKVVQYNNEMELIKIWDSVNEASKRLNINRASIRNCLAKRYKTAGGFIWKYYDEVYKDVVLKNKSW